MSLFQQAVENLDSMSRARRIVELEQSLQVLTSSISKGFQCITHRNSSSNVSFAEPGTHYDGCVFAEVSEKHVKILFSRRVRTSIECDDRNSDAAKIEKDKIRSMFKTPISIYYHDNNGCGRAWGYEFALSPGWENNAEIVSDLVTALSKCFLPRAS